MSRAAIANAWLDGYKPPSDRAIEFARLYAEEELTLQEIGDRHNLSRERVRQLIAPFGIKAHGGERKRREREETLREAHARIIAGETTTAEETERLGYGDPAYLRSALWRLGLKLRRVARGPAEKRQAAHDRYLARVQRGPSNHGTVSAYKNFGCRCPACRIANRLYENERRPGRKEGTDVAD